MFQIYGFTVKNGCASVPVEEILKKHGGEFLNETQVENLGLETVSLSSGTEALCVIPSKNLDEADSLAESLGYRPASSEEFFGLLDTLTTINLGWCFWVVCRVSEEFWHLYGYAPERSQWGTLPLFSRASQGRQNEGNMSYCTLYVKK